MNKSFYDYLNNDADGLRIAINIAIVPIFDKYLILGYSRKEIASLIKDEIDHLMIFVSDKLNEIE